MKAMIFLFASSILLATWASARAADFCKDKPPVENVFSGGPSNLGILKNQQLIYYYKHKNNSARNSLRFERPTAKIKQR